jgi:hypothetical protein
MPRRCMAAAIRTPPQTRPWTADVGDGEPRAARFARGDEAAEFVQRLVGAFATREGGREEALAIRRGQRSLRDLLPPRYPGEFAPLSGFG